MDSPCHPAIFTAPRTESQLAPETSTKGTVRAHYAAKVTPTARSPSDLVPAKHVRHHPTTHLATHETPHLYHINGTTSCKA